MTDPDSAPVTNSSTRHVIEALRLITRSAAPIGLGEIAEAMDLPQSTAHRALMTLEESGFAMRGAQGARLAAAPIVHHLIRSMVALFPARALLVEPMRALSAEHDVTVSLNWRVGWSSLRLLSVEGSHESYQLRRVGEARPLHSGVGPRAILAGMEAADIARYAAEAEAPPPLDTLLALRKALRAEGVIERTPSDYSSLHWLGGPLYGRGRRASGSIAVGFESGVFATPEGRAEAVATVLSHLSAMQAVLDEAGDVASPFDGMEPSEVKMGQGGPQA